jgi:hypothetical protein
MATVDCLRVRLICAHGGAGEMLRRMLILGLLAACGCTYLPLARRTVKQGSTLSGLQYQQVLDNLAMFACDPDALAWHVKVTGGLVQVADQGSAGILPSGAGNPLIAPSLSLVRNVVGQWNVDAVIESDDLENLQLAYQKAINPTDPERAIKKQVFEKVGELSATYHIVLSKEVIAEMIETLQLGASPERAEKLKRTGKELAELYERVEELVEKVPNPMTDPDSAGGSPEDIARLLAVKKEIIKLTGSLCEEPFVVGYSLDKAPRSPALVEQAEDKIKSLVELVTDRGEEPNPFSLPWVCSGCKKDVPPCACYVGHFHGCHCDCYIWVTPEHAKTLRNFTLTILSLAPPDVQESLMPRLGIGAANSPNF